MNPGGKGLQAMTPSPTLVLPSGYGESSGPASLKPGVWDLSCQQQGYQKGKNGDERTYLFGLKQRLLLAPGL